jgi:hypothetical protein
MISLMMALLVASSNAFAPRQQIITTSPRPVLGHSSNLFSPRTPNDVASKTALQMSVGLGAIAATVSGGLFAGGLHALSGTCDVIDVLRKQINVC